MEIIAGEVWIWVDAGRVFTRVKTNADERRLRRRLCELGLCDLVERCERHPDPTRMHGGSYFDLLWRDGVEFDRLREKLHEL